MKSFMKWMESFQIKEDLFNRTPQVPNSEEDKEKIISLYEFMLNNNTLSTTIADTATSNG